MPLLDAVRSLAKASSSEDAARAILRSLARTTPANALALLRAGDDGYLGQAQDEESQDRRGEAALGYSKVCNGRPGNAARAARLLGLSRSFTCKTAIRPGILPPAGKH